MTRIEKIAAIRNALTEEQREWLCEVIESSELVFHYLHYEDADGTLSQLAQEFRDETSVG